MSALLSRRFATTRYISSIWLEEPEAHAVTRVSVDGVPGRYWHQLEDGRTQCDLGPRNCRLQDGQRGLCFVRGRAGDQIVLTTYGRSSGFCIDPIEKKPLNHFLPGTPVLSFGTAGCKSVGHIKPLFSRFPKGGWRRRQP
jgi:hypothetical protein